MSNTFFSRTEIGIANNDKDTVTSKPKSQVLCIVFDLKISFEYLISSFCKKASRNLNSFARIDSRI